MSEGQIKEYILGSLHVHWNGTCYEASLRVGPSSIDIPVVTSLFYEECKTKAERFAVMLAAFLYGAHHLTESGARNVQKKEKS